MDSTSNSDTAPTEITTSSTRVPKSKWEKAIRKQKAQKRVHLDSSGSDNQPEAKKQKLSTAPTTATTTPTQQLQGIQRLILQPMLTTTLLQCRSCSFDTRNKYEPKSLADNKVLLNLVLCENCLSVNKKVKYINNFQILPHNVPNYQQPQKKSSN
jgi:hypothetical protein